MGAPRRSTRRALFSFAWGGPLHLDQIWHWVELVVVGLLSLLFYQERELRKKRDDDLNALTQSIEALTAALDKEKDARVAGDYAQNNALHEHKLYAAEQFATSDDVAQATQKIEGRFDRVEAKIDTLNARTRRA